MIPKHPQSNWELHFEQEIMYLLSSKQIEHCPSSRVTGGSTAGGCSDEIDSASMMMGASSFSGIDEFD